MESYHSFRYVEKCYLGGHEATSNWLLKDWENFIEFYFSLLKLCFFVIFFIDSCNFECLLLFIVPFHLILFMLLLMQVPTTKLVGYRTNKKSMWSFQIL
ncbi:unnamed protein product [Prunus brigantina]